ncbi:hypothetical protein [Enterovibrio calviensis]|uniref:hypothetical protein n=1 Tax=Enterovibrio calviensis TaxID=91359 RepID=UPI0037368558
MTPAELKEIIESSIEAKSFLSNWHYILMALLPFIGAFAGSFLKKRGESLAERRGFKSTLKRIETKVNSVKLIEEKISHDYLETREIHRIKREKIESIYLAIIKEREVLGQNLTIAASDAMRDLFWPSNEIQMYVSLYFKDDMEKELEYYLEHRRVLISRIRELSEENYSKVAIQGQKRVDTNMPYYRTYHQATVNIELGLEEQMKILTRP